jgi:hypothetical protein
MLLTDRRRSFGRREEDNERDPWQGSLFALDALGPPARPPGTTPDPFALRRPPAAPPSETPAPPDQVAPPADEVLPEELATSPADAIVAPSEVAAPDFAAPPDYDDETAEYVVEDPPELEPAHARPTASRSVLAGPTLDDVMSRVWEGLRAEVPTPCPVCHAEIEPSAHGHCGACGSTLA